MSHYLKLQQHKIDAAFVAARKALLPAVRAARGQRTGDKAAARRKPVSSQAPHSG